MALHVEDADRFGTMNLAQKKQREQELQNRNTVSNEEKAVKCFKLYLKSIGLQDTNFFDFSEDELDRHLVTWYFNARTKSKEHYTTGSFTTLRYGLNRALKKQGRNLTSHAKNVHSSLHLSKPLKPPNVNSTDGKRSCKKHTRNHTST